MDYSIDGRIARIESDVAHLRTDVADIKTDLRSVGDKLDELRDSTAKDSASLRESMIVGDASLRESVAKVRESIVAAKVWGLGLALTIATAIFGAMARGFGWI